MIAYQLQCRNGHGFEGWFRDSAAYDAQAAGGKLSCPTCNTRKVQKAVMAPAIAGKAREQAQERDKARAALKSMRQAMLKDAEHVGGAFPEEARKMHYGESDPRAIYGEASVDEVVSLLDEGVPVAPIPPDPDKAN